MKWFDKVKEDRRFKLVGIIVVALWSFYFVMNMFFVLGEINVCNNMNGSLVKDEGVNVCINTMVIPICEDSFGMIHKDSGDFGFNYSGVVMD